MRDKRGSLVINLIETPNGFSIVEGTQLLNKVALSMEKQAQTAQTSSILNAMNSSGSLPSQLKEQKSVYQKINLVFPKNPLKSQSNQNTSELIYDINQREMINKKITSNAEAGKATEWFSMNSTHQNQKNQIRLWYAEQHPQESLNQIQTSKEFYRYLETYKKHRNIIVTLYYKEYFPRQTYLPASQIRKRIPYDAYWLMKIHTFLSNNFIINSHTSNYSNGFFGSNQYLYKFNLDKGKFQMLDYEFDLGLQDRNSITKQENDQQNKTLKFITQKIRPFCDYCGIHCGIVWFYHFKQTDPKQIAVIMKNVNSKNPPLSQKPYQMTLCTRCYCDGNFPLLLTHHDFKKNTVNDKLQPNKKRKLRKKKKDKKRKRKQRQQERQKQDEQEIFQQNQDKEYDQDGNKILEERQQNQKPEQDLAAQKVEEIPLKEQNLIVPEQQNVTSVIQSIINSLQKHKQWTLEQTLKLLSLVQKHGQDWNLIRDILNEQDPTNQCSVQEILNYFVSLPRRKVSKMKEEYDSQQFLLENYKTNRNSVSDSIAQRTLNRCISLSNKIQQIRKPNKNVSIQNNCEKRQWEQNLKKYVGLEQQKLMNRIRQLQKKEGLCVQVMRRLTKVKN